MAMMTTVKSSRSRPAQTSGLLSSSAILSAEEAIQLSDKLQIFKASGFDPEKFVQSKCPTMSEKVALFSFFFDPVGIPSDIFICLWQFYYLGKKTHLFGVNVDFFPDCNVGELVFTR